MLVLIVLPRTPAFTHARTDDIPIFSRVREAYEEESCKEVSMMDLFIVQGTEVVQDDLLHIDREPVELATYPEPEEHTPVGEKNMKP